MDGELLVDGFGDAAVEWSHSAVVPDADVVEGGLGGETGSEAGQVMGMIITEAEGVQQATIDRFNNLAQANGPTTHRLGPARHTSRCRTAYTSAAYGSCQYSSHRSLAKSESPGSRECRE